MVMRELYTDFYIGSSRSNTMENYVYSTIIKYPEENIFNFVNRYEATLDEYIRHDVKKYLGVTFLEYLELTYQEKDVVLEACVRETKRAIEAAEAAKRDSNAEINKIKAGMLSKESTYSGLTNKKEIKPQHTPKQQPPIDRFDLEEILGD